PALMLICMLILQFGLWFNARQTALAAAQAGAAVARQEAASRPDRWQADAAGTPPRHYPKPNNKPAQQGQPHTPPGAGGDGQRAHRRGSRGERLRHGGRPGRRLGVPVLRTAPERVGHRGRPGRMFPSRQPERSLLMRWVRAGRPLTSEAEHERRAAGAGGAASTLRAAAPPAPRPCWSGGQPPDPRASRTARWRASGATMRCASRRASGTTSREGGRRCERGSISVELVVLAPGLALLLLLIAAGARVVEVQGHIDGAARDAARAASAARSYTEAGPAAPQAGQAEPGPTRPGAPAPRGGP